MNDWRSEVRRLAEEQAIREAQQKWRASAEDVIPFNHRWEHVQAVVGLALRLAAELDADRDVVEAAAWLHDVRKGEPQHALAGAQVAARLLPDTDFPRGKVPRVVEAIRQHEGLYRDPGAAPLEPVEAAILWDADKLSKLGVQAIIHSISAPYAAGQGLAERRRRYAEFAADVFRRTVESMNTEPGRRMAARRYEAMQKALADWEREEEEQDLMNNE